MKTPAPHKDESQRLVTLQLFGLLDTLPEERFDRITRMAKRLFNVEMSLVSLVDSGRQWFKSAQGLDAKETPRDISFCGHAILGDEPFIVSDASTDARFSDNPLVQGHPNIRFYAGCPIKAPNGLPLGTLCVIDDKPRDVTDEDLEALIDLGQLVENEIAMAESQSIDAISGISNRNGFIELAQQTLQVCQRSNLNASLLCLTLTSLQTDSALREKQLYGFARVLENAFRESDIFAHLADGKFVILLSNANKKQVSEVMCRFDNEVTSFNAQHADELEIEYFFGVVPYEPTLHASIHSLMAEAEDLMQQIGA
ncbi:GAF domain-containing protein [Enterovibrio coralii]|uniref:GGDEF domain-containing protein n=1 Tax=Enterovibrio coralii TaxID=294935 RepID=A0A135I9C9_9GAMM|nr:GAF domain-containing protein [Enterovibrio coralii]KXF82037.1 hypothetical protein ATN88_19675 [Enterovibrio coralii]